MAKPHKLHNAIQKELRELRQLEIIDQEQYATLMMRYPTEPWDIGILIRWFSLLGMLSMFGGGLLLLEKLLQFKLIYHYVVKAIAWFFDIPFTIEATIALGGALVFLLSRHLKKKQSLPYFSSLLELLTALFITAFSLVLGDRLSTGSGNWPLLIGADAVVFVYLAYRLNNRLVLTYATINTFLALGGEVGFLAGWGAYWLNLGQPILFVIAGTGCTYLGWLHLQGKVEKLIPYKHFSRVYLHFGLLTMNLAMWFAALFGSLSGSSRFDHNLFGRVVFSLLWAGLSFASIHTGIQRNLSVLRSYGWVFLILNLYTAYFQFVIFHSVIIWYIHMLLVGGSLLYLVRFLESKDLLRKTKEKTTPEHSSEETTNQEEKPNPSISEEKQNSSPSDPEL